MKTMLNKSAALAAIILLGQIGAGNAASAESAAGEAAPNASAWKVTSSTSALDGKARYSAQLDSSNKIANSVGRDDVATLVVRCTPEEGLASYIVWPGFVGTQDVDVTYRIDEAPVLVQSWSASGSGRASGLFHGPANLVFLTKLSAAHRLVVRTPRYDATPIEAVFDLAGAAEVISGAEKACP